MENEEVYSKSARAEKVVGLRGDNGTITQSCDCEHCDTQEKIEDNLINTYHEKVNDFINSRKKKVSL